MNNIEQKAKTVMVVGGMIYDHMDGVKQAWIHMIEDVLVSNGYMPEFNEFAELAYCVGISKASPETLKTVWWDKYQSMVREIGGVLSGNNQ